MHQASASAASIRMARFSLGIRTTFGSWAAPSAAPLALQGVDALAQALDLGPLAVPVALELPEELRKRGGEQAQHGAARARDHRPGRAAAGRRRRLADAQGRQRRIRPLAAQAQEQLVGVGQYAPFRARTTGIVRAMMVRSSQIDQVSM
jgi:hypothetical protein